MVKVLAAFPVMMGALVLVGWGVGSGWLERLGLASSTMNPLTAVCVMLLGVGMLSRNPVWRAGSRLPGLTAGLVASAALLKLTDLLAGTHLGIDQALFSSAVAHDWPRPSRMAPNTAAALVLMSLTLATLYRGPRRSVLTAQLAACATALIAAFAVLGHLFDVSAFYVVGPFHPMALHAAFAFLSLSAAALVHTRNRVLMVPVSDSGPAGRTSRTLLPAAVAIPVGLAWLRQQGEQAGLFRAELGVALMVTITIVVFVLLIWQNARSLLRADRLRRHAEARVSHMAAHDFLTGLANRASFMECLEQRMKLVGSPEGGCLAVVYMDLDGFKQVNDQLGHAAGDSLLIEVANHLRLCGQRPGDLVARIGGDEFAILLEEVSCASAAAAVASRIITDFAPRFGGADRPVPIGISIGIAVAEAAHLTADALVSDADDALYQAKQAGRGTYALSARPRSIPNSPTLDPLPPDPSMQVTQERARPPRRDDCDLPPLAA